MKLVLLIMTFLLASCGNKDTFSYRYCNNAANQQISCENGQVIP